MRVKLFLLGILVNIVGFATSSISAAYDNRNNLGWQLVVPASATDFRLIGLALEQRAGLTGAVARVQAADGAEQRIPFGGPNFGVNQAMWHLGWFYTQRDCASALAGPLVWTQTAKPIECLRANVGAVENGLDVVVLKSADGAIWGAMHYASGFTVAMRALGPVLGTMAGVVLMAAAIFPVRRRSQSALAVWA
jgi:hypothetical protein